MESHRRYRTTDSNIYGQLQLVPKSMGGGPHTFLSYQALTSGGQTNHDNYNSRVFNLYPFTVSLPI